jgi:hypothetical protein
MQRIGPVYAPGWARLREEAQNRALGRPARGSAFRKVPSGRSLPYLALHREGKVCKLQLRADVINRDGAASSEEWIMSGSGLGRVKTKSELVVMPSGRQNRVEFLHNQGQ